MVRQDDEHDDLVTLLEDVRTELGQEIENVRTELREEIADVRTDLGGRIDRTYDLPVERDGRVAAS